MIDALKTENYSPRIFTNLLKIRYKAINSFLDKPRLKFSRISGDFPEKFCTGRVGLSHSPVTFIEFLYGGLPCKTDTPRAGPCRFSVLFLTLL